MPIVGGTLRVARWGTGPNVILAAHGITGSSMAWTGVARRIAPDWSLVAPDLRGRGHSADAPDLDGLAGHAADLLTVAGHIGATRVVLAGHSMGAYVVILAAAARPDLVARVVLIDGGLPRPLPAAGDDLDAALAQRLGMTFARLDRTFPTPEHYIDFWRAHPAFSATIDEHLETYFRYDLQGTEPEFRSRVRKESVLMDGRDIVARTDALGAALRGLRSPVVLLRAPLGMAGEPPGMVPPPMVDLWAPQISELQHELVPDCNHTTIMFADRAAAIVAARLQWAPVTDATDAGDVVVPPISRRPAVAAGSAG